MKVSVVIPTHNRAALVYECVQSVLAQSYQDREIIVIDDGSTDRTRELLVPLVQDNKIQYIYQENKGPGAASQKGLGLATGELISFLDGDDLWAPDMLDWQVRYLDEHPDVAAVGGGYECIDESGFKIRPASVRDAEISFADAFAGAPFLTIGQTLIRRQLILDAGGFDQTVWAAQDFDLWLKLARHGHRIISVPRMALYYRKHAANTSGNVLLMYENCEMVIHKHLPFLPPRTRARVKRQAFRWLYEYRGQCIIMRCKASIRKGHASDLPRVAAMVMRLMAVAIGDWPLLRRLCLDVFIPVRFHLGNPDVNLFGAPNDPANG